MRAGLELLPAVPGTICDRWPAGSASPLSSAASLALRRFAIPSRRSLSTQIGLAIGALAAIIAATNFTHPFYIGNEPVASVIIS